MNAAMAKLNLGERDALKDFSPLQLLRFDAQFESAVISLRRREIIESQLPTNLADWKSKRGKTTAEAGRILNELVQATRYQIIRSNPATSKKDRVENTRGVVSKAGHAALEALTAALDKSELADRIESIITHLKEAHGINQEATA